MPSVDISLLQKHCGGTPKNISRDVANLAGEITRLEAPFYVDIVPEFDAEPNQCFYNVMRKIDRDGGQILYGWRFYEWPRVYVEAEHHAIWTDGETYVDVTPLEFDETRTLFVSEQTKVYDFEGNSRLPNVRRATSNLKSVPEWFRVCEAYHERMEELSEGLVIKIDRSELFELERRKALAQAAIYVELAAKMGRNDPCFCQSGKKFKKCCSNLIDVGA